MQLVAVDYQAENAQEEFVKSLRETGFGVLKNHPIQQSLVQGIYDNWQGFFNSDRRTITFITKVSKTVFFPQSVSEVAKGFTKKDIKEYYHFYPWGQCPDTLRPQISQYYEEANGLAKELLGWIEKHSPSEVSGKYSQPLGDMIKDSDQNLATYTALPTT